MEGLFILGQLPADAYRAPTMYVPSTVLGMETLFLTCNCPTKCFYGGFRVPV